MKWRIYISAIILIALVSCKGKEEEVRPQVKELTEAVYASGTLVPEEEYKVVADLQGYLVSTLVKEGDTVKKGQLLFTLSSATKQVEEQSANALLEKTRATSNASAPQFRELEARIELAQIRLQNDSIQYVRYKNLYDQDAISKSNYEKYLLQYQASSRELYSLNQQLQQQQLAADLQLQQASNQVAISRAIIGNGQLKSFADGVLYEIYKKEGDLVIPNQPLALIGRGKMIAKLSIDEDDLDKVREGQKVLITMDAFPNRVVKATITRIYPMLNKIEQSFRADAELDEALPEAIYGLNIEANIVIHENKKVMVIPRKALLPGDSVRLKENGKISTVKVLKGAEDREWVEIQSGIGSHSLLIVSL